MDSLSSSVISITMIMLLIAGAGALKQVLVDSGVSKYIGELMMEKAFQDTLRDKEFLAEAEKAKLDIEPVTSGELQKSVAGIFKLNPSLITKLNDVLFK